MTYQAATDEQNIRSSCRAYIVDQLRVHGCHDIADQLMLEYKETADDSYQVLLKVANQLEHERRQQFKDILYHLQLTNENLKATYDTIVVEMFRDGIHWGRVVAFLVFSSKLAVFCAQHGMEARVKDVILWTETQMTTRLQQWILEQGGWRAFIEHFDEASIYETLRSIPSGLYVAGAVAVLAGGVYFLTKLL